VGLRTLSPMDTTLVICKPDAVERGLVGEILSRFERRNLRIVALERRQVSEELAAEHYAEHAGKPFYGELISFITRSPVVVAVIEGPEDTWQVVRTMVGATNPREAAPGTIRGDLGILFTENLIHGSDSADSAAREVALWFPAGPG
jgi:nucleoside-diphosphate kinase